MRPLDVIRHLDVAELTLAEKIALIEAESRAQKSAKDGAAPRTDALAWSDPRVPANAATAARIRQEHGAPADPAPAPEALFQKLSAVEVTKVDWLWEPRIPRGFLTIIEGIEGVGKSTLLCAIAAAVTRGRGGEGFSLAEPANVVWLSAEDNLAPVLKPRLLAAGADVERIIASEDTFRLNADGARLLREQLEAHQPALVIIDPIFAYTPGDPSKGADARGATNLLKTLAAEFNCAIILVRHVGKSKGGGDPRAAGLYSIEWRAAARSVLLAGVDPDNQAKRALAQTKNNFGALADPIGYSIEPDQASPSGARFYWTGRSDLTAQRILAAIEPEEVRAARREAIDWLREILGDGERRASEILAEAKAEQISDKTLYRAKKDLGVQSRCESKKGTKAKIWYWRLPGEDGQALPSSDEDGQMPVEWPSSSNNSNKSSYGNNLVKMATLQASGHLQAEEGGLGHLQEREIFEI